MNNLIHTGYSLALLVTLACRSLSLDIPPPFHPPPTAPRLSNTEIESEGELREVGGNHSQER